MGDPHSTDPLSTARTTNSNPIDPLVTTETTNLFKKMTGTGGNKNAAPIAVADSDSFDPELAASDLSVPPANGTAFKLNGITFYAAPSA